MKARRYFSRGRVRRLLIGVAVVLATTVWAVPLWYGMNNAFKKEKWVLIEPLFLRSESFTFESIIYTFEKMHYLRHFMNSVLILVFASIIFIPLGALAGYGIATSRNSWLNKLYYFLVASIAFPFALAMIPLVIQLREMHLLDLRFGTALVMASTALPFVIFLYAGFMKTVPKELEEAAFVDGSSLFGTFWRIYLPNLKQITATVLIIRGVGIWNDLLTGLITLSSPKKFPLMFMLYIFVGAGGFRKTSWHLLFGASLLVSLPVMILFVSLQRYFQAGAITGALKR